MLSKCIAPLALLIVSALFALGLAGCMEGSRIGAPLLAERLECEYRVEPRGIATTTPRFSWRLAANDPSARGIGQSAYRIIAAESRDALTPTSKPNQLLWDTGTVHGDAGRATSQIDYRGTFLSSRTRVWWKVQIWDENGRDCGWSDPASFTVGIIDPSGWKAEWIGLDVAPAAPLTAQVRTDLRNLPWIRLPGPPMRQERVAFFRSEFDLGADTIESAWLAATVDQIAQLSVNGQPAAELARWDFSRAIDVAASLKPGRNAVGFRVEHADGFNPAVTGMLVVTFAGGRQQRFLIDKSWKLFEVAVEGWDRVGLNDSAWKQVEESRAQPWGGSRNTEHFMPPAPYLRKTFTVTQGKPIARATLFATALGVYQCSLNGLRIASDEFTPGWTEYNKRVYHQTYDVTSMVRPGTNCIGAILGDGWYASLMSFTGRRRFYDGPARFMGQLEIEYTDGSRQTIASDSTWTAAFGPIRHADLYLGTDYDSRLEIPGWDQPQLTGAAAKANWIPVQTGLAQAQSRREADVTAKVANAIKDGRLDMLVSPVTLGDPAYGVVKTLDIEYSFNGIRGQTTINENQRLQLPGPNHLGPVTIIKAVFGEPARPPAKPFVIEPQPGEPVRRFEALAAKTVSEPRPGRYVFNLGQNMVGWARLKVNGTPGQRLVVRHAEMLNPDGTMYTSNLRGATATDFYTLKGGPETLEPPFTFHGFQYVEITGLTSKPEPSMVTGIVTHTAMMPAGTFSCSSPLVNQLVHNIIWGQKGNYLEVPTDCPQRDERLGWTGDAQFFINTAAYTFDIASFMSRWLKTLNHDSQYEDGTFAHVAPKVDQRGGSTAWGDAAIVCTHSMYITYGDKRIIADNYEPMSRYMVWLDSKTTNGIAKVGGFGDWLNLNDPTSSDLIDTAYRANLLSIMSEMARVIGETADADRFAAGHRFTVDAFRTRFLNADGSLKESGQTGYALAFTNGLIPEALHAQAAAHFASTLEKKNWHLATGFIGTPRLLPALYIAGGETCRAGANRVLLNEDYPSWLYQVKLGATTMWERWDGWTPERGFSDVGMNSFNHYAFGSVGDYLYRHVAGISPLAPGYTRVLIAPTPGPGSLTSAKATYDSIAGTIASQWARADDATTYEITIPPNVTGEIRLSVAPGQSLFESGRRVADGGVQGLRILAADPSLEANVVRMDAQSGTYRFTVSNPVK